MKNKKSLAIYISAGMVILLAVLGIVFLLNPKSKSAVSSSVPPAASTSQKNAIPTVSNKAYISGMVYKQETLLQTVYSSITNNFAGFKNGAPLSINTVENKIFNLLTNENVNDIDFRQFDNSFSFASCFPDGSGNIGYLYLEQSTKNLFFAKTSALGETILSDIKLENYSGKIETYDGCHYAQINQVAMDSQNIYIIFKTDNDVELAIYGLDGSQKASFAQTNSIFLDESGGKLYFCQEGSLICLNTKDFSEIFNVFLNTTEINTKISVDTKSGTVFVCGPKSVDTYDADNGNYIEQVVNEIICKDFSALISKQDYSDVFSPDIFFVDENKALYFGLTVQGKTLLETHYFRFSLETGNVVQEAAAIKISAPYRSDYLSDAITAFKHTNPDITIEYNYDYNSYTSYLQSSSNDYSTRLSTQLLAGDAGDIVFLGGAKNTERFLLASDLLYDLTEMINSGNDYKQYDSKMLSGITLNGKIKGFPLTEYFMYMTANTALLDELGVEMDLDNLTWSEILSLTEILEKNAPDIALFSNITGENSSDLIQNYFVRMINANSPDLYNPEQKTINLEQKWFCDLLEQYKKASKSPNFIVKINFESPVDTLNDKALFNIEASGSNLSQSYLGDVLVWNARYNEMPNKSSRYISLPAGEMSSNHCAYSTDMYGITASSENKEAAWKFLQFAASAEMQSGRAYPGIPLNIDGRSRKVDAILQKRQAQLETLENAKNDILKICDNVDYMYDGYLYKVDLQMPLIDYLNDKLTLDEALRKSHQNIMLRMNE